jgi:hypothetical protein
MHIVKTKFGFKAYALCADVCFVYLTVDSCFAEALKKIGSVAVCFVSGIEFKETFVGKIKDRKLVFT